VSAADLDATDWPQFLPYSHGRIDREAKAGLAGRRILALRDQRRVGRLGQGGHRVELLLAGSPPVFARLTSGTEIELRVLDALGDAASRAELDWEPSLFLRPPPAADEEFRRQFLRLWDAAGTTQYDKAEWRRFARRLRDAGYPA
jgi:hypothetical protein